MRLLPAFILFSSCALAPACGAGSPAGAGMNEGVGVREVGQRGAETPHPPRGVGACFFLHFVL